MRNFLFTLSLLLLTLIDVGYGQTSELLFETDEVIWGGAFLSETQVLITQKNGVMKVVDLNKKSATPVAGVPRVWNKGQGGLLDVALDPKFGQNSWIYFTAAVELPDKTSTTELFRATLSENKLTDLKSLFSARPGLKSNKHYGSRIAFDTKTNSLFVSVGDRDERDLAQVKENHIGKIIQIDKTTLSASTWSLGHRNPQGIFWQEATGELWVVEHGPRGGDEVNLAKKGQNYGWPKYTKGREYWGPSIGKKDSSKGFTEPLFTYTPSIAPSALLIYTGAQFPKWKDHFFIPALARQHISVIKREGAGFKEVTKLFENLNERIRWIGASPSGQILFSTDSGRLYRMK